MNVLFTAVILILCLYLGYKFYANIIEKKVFQFQKNKQTPAHEINDGIDYSPANKIILFGHHFSAIAGAGPILGPLVAVLYFGWLGALIWVILGSIFIGGVHDYLSLMISVRNKGTSIADISEKALGRRSKIIFSLFLWFALILVIAVFAIVTSQTLVSQPKIVIPTFGLIFLAIIFGLLVYKKGVNVSAATAVSLVVLFLLIYLGHLFPVTLPHYVFGISAQHFWFLILILYSLVASCLPVWFLLQPRGYISTWILFFGMGLGFLGLILTNPKYNAPAFVSFSSEGGPLWPMLFVLIACGAISGFHSVVASGTTSKQLSNESHGKLVGYGSMIFEAGLAGFVIFIASSALIWDPSGTPVPLSYQGIMAAGDPIQAFSLGYSEFVSSLPGLGVTAGLLFGMLMLNTFVLTSLDTSVRLGRFISVELVGKKYPILRNRWITSSILVILAAFLGITESYKAIWPVFGASNQLIAAFSFIIITSYLVGLKKPKAYTLYPAIFMLITTVAALCYQGYAFFKSDSYTLGSMSLLLLILTVFILLDAKKIMFPKRKGLSDKL